MTLKTYNVALWLYWPAHFPDVDQDVEAANFEGAVLAAMRSLGNRSVARAAVRQYVLRAGPDGQVRRIESPVIVRYQHLRLVPSGILAELVPCSEVN